MGLIDFKAGQVEPTLGKTIKEVIIASDTFIVYLDTNSTIQWATEGYTDFPDDFGKIQNQISFWESVCNKVFDKEEAYDFKTLLAEGYARTLDDKNAKAAQEIVDTTVNRIKSVGTEKIRLSYLISSFITTLIVGLVILLVWSNKTGIIENSGNNYFDVLMCSLVGGVGAFISTFIRSKSYNTEISAGKCIHIFDGILRIFYGLVAGSVICLAVKSNVALGFIEGMEKSFSVELFFSMIAGASEILIPSIVKKS